MNSVTRRRGTVITAGAARRTIATTSPSTAAMRKPTTVASRVIRNPSSRIGMLSMARSQLQSTLIGPPPLPR